MHISKKNIMALDKKPIVDLRNYEFIIPNYQRGYRWDYEQVEALLNDLYAFWCGNQDAIQAFMGGNKDVKPNEFYCLQPVVVVPENAGDVGNRRFIVVDGQQRLTTLYLIIKALEGDKAECFTLQMDQRKEQESFLTSCEFMRDTSDYTKNIDNFYVQKAYDTIVAWVGTSTEKKKAITDLLTSSRTNYAAVIWYVIPGSDALEAFRRLNYGKIPLTPAELVKALILQTDCYLPKERDLQMAMAQRRSMEWDEMGHRLSNPLFASMVTKKGVGVDNGIEIILDFVADELNDEIREKAPDKALARKENKAADVQDNFVFNVVDEWIKMTVDAGHLRSVAIQKLWQHIQATFNLLVDWFDDREWFHLIGLCRLMSNDDTRVFISEIYKLSRVENKGQFTEALRKRIGRLIKVPTVKDAPDDKQGLLSPELRYGKRNANIIGILEALNVKAAMDDMSESVRFPFDLFQKFNTTSLEHIHPQNIDETMSYEDARAWVADRETDAGEATAQAWLRAAESFDIDSADKAEAITKAKEKVTGSIKVLNGLLRSEEAYHAADSEELRAHIGVLDTLFGDIAGIDPDTLHSIRNMALVSKELNSALSNRHLDAKRHIIARQTADKKTFVPECTLRVFNKQYRIADGKNPSGTPGNMKFWQPEDRTAYMAAIQSVYDYFTK